MIRKRVVDMAPALLIGLASLLAAQPALACSVCVGGDPNASMNQGLQAGMLVLLGVAGVVLTGVASLSLFWMRRAAQLRAQVEAIEEAGRAESRLKDLVETPSVALHPARPTAG